VVCEIKNETSGGREGPRERILRASNWRRCPSSGGASERKSDTPLQREEESVYTGKRCIGKEIASMDEHARYTVSNESFRLSGTLLYIPLHFKAAVLSINSSFSNFILPSLFTNENDIFIGN
jgi:hypothetical protein